MPIVRVRVVVVQRRSCRRRGGEKVGIGSLRGGETLRAQDGHGARAIRDTLHRGLVERVIQEHGHVVGGKELPLGSVEGVMLRIHKARCHFLCLIVRRGNKNVKWDLVYQFLKSRDARYCSSIFLFLRSRVLPSKKTIPCLV